MESARRGSQPIPKSSAPLGIGRARLPSSALARTQISRVGARDEPWKSADIHAFGYVARFHSSQLEASTRHSRKNYLLHGHPLVNVCFELMV